MPIGNTLMTNVDIESTKRGRFLRMQREDIAISVQEPIIFFYLLHGSYLVNYSESLHYIINL